MYNERLLTFKIVSQAYIRYTNPHVLDFVVDMVGMATLTRQGGSLDLDRQTLDGDSSGIVETLL